MQALSLFSQVTLYLLLALMCLLACVVWWAQFNILRGKPFNNPDGTVDDWHEQKIFYGIALADIFLACPTSIVGVILVFLMPRWGFYLLALASFWFLWANVMTTVTSLRFEKPRITLQWFIVFPFGALVGLAYIVWSVLHLDAIFLP